MQYAIGTRVKKFVGIIGGKRRFLVGTVTRIATKGNEVTIKCDSGATLVVVATDKHLGKV